MRYTDPHNDKAPFDSAKSERMDAGRPVHRRIEHAILHLLYSRFFTKVLRDEGMLAFDEPFTNLLCQGMVLDENGDVMSKSKGNVIAPGGHDRELRRRCRARLHPVHGPARQRAFVERGRLGGHVQVHEPPLASGERSRRGTAGEETLFAGGELDTDAVHKLSKTLMRERHRVVGKVVDDFDRNNFNTAIAAIMELANATGEYLRKVSLEARRSCDHAEAFDRDIAEVIVKLMAPIAPHWAEELWQTVLGHEGSVHVEAWPAFDPALAKADEVELAVQVNGKVKAKITVAADAVEDEVKALAQRGRLARHRRQRAQKGRLRCRALGEHRR